MLMSGAAEVCAEQNSAYSIGILSPGDTVRGGDDVVFRAVLLDEEKDTVPVDSVDGYLNFSWAANPDSLLQDTPYYIHGSQFTVEPRSTNGLLTIRLTVSGEDLEGFGEEMGDSVTIQILPELPSRITLEPADVALDTTSSPFHRAFYLMGTIDTMPLRAVLRNESSDFLDYAETATWRVGPANVLLPSDKPWKRDLAAGSADSGFVAVSYELDGRVLTDSVPVVVRRPHRPELFFVTDTGESIVPPRDLEAGQPVGMIVRLGTSQDTFYNSSEFKIPVMVNDLAQVPEELKLDDWPRVSAESQLNYDQVPLGEGVVLTFVDGVAKFDLTLFRVPTLSDSLDMHYISIELGRSGLADTTGKFSILPGPPDGMNIYLADGTLPDTTLRIDLNGDNVDSTVTFLARTDSVDVYGNSIEPLRPARWILDPELGIVEGGDSSVTFPLVLDHRSDVEGVLRAEIDAGRTTISDGQFIKVTGWGAHLLRAETMDRDNDGLLDGARLRFDRPLGTGADSLYAKTRVYYSGDGDRVDFVISEHKILPGSTTAELYFSEFTGEFPVDHQTDWRPRVSIRGLDGVADATKVETEDNVGPLIWYAAVDSLSDSLLVRITFTEDLDWFGKPDSLETPSRRVDTLQVSPSTLFQLGVMGGNNVFVPVSDNSLSSVSSMLAGPNFVEFSLDTETRIDSLNAFRILVTADSVLQDLHGNSAQSHDWVRVIPLGDAPAPGSQPGDGEADPEDTTATTPKEEYPEGACGDCGTGVWHAFIPLIWLRVAGTLRKKKKKK